MADGGKSYVARIFRSILPRRSPQKRLSVLNADVDFRSGEGKSNLLFRDAVGEEEGESYVIGGLRPDVRGCRAWEREGGEEREKRGSSGYEEGRRGVGI